MESIIKVGIDAGPAKQGQQEVDRAAALVNASVDRMIGKFDDLNKSLKESASWQAEVAREITKAGEASRSNPWQREMAVQLSQINATLKYTKGGFDDLLGAQQKFNKTAKDGAYQVSALGTEFQGLSTSMNQSLDLLGRLAGYAQKGYGFAKTSAEISELRDNFNAFMLSARVDPTKMLGGVQSQLSGMVSQIDAMKMSMAAVNKGIAQDPETIARLVEISDALADAAADGRTTEQVFNQLTDTIARGSARGLAQLGLLPDYMSLSADKADILMKKSELLAIVLEGGAEKIEIMGKAGGSASDQFLKLEAAFADARAELGDALMPAFKAFVDYARADIIPAIEGIAEVIRDMTGAADAQSRALAKMSNIGAAAEIAKKQKELDEANARLNNRNNKWDVTSPEYIELAARRDALELEIKKIVRTGKRTNQAEMLSVDLSYMAKDAKDAFDKTLDAFDVFSGEVSKKSGAAKEKISKDVKDLWEEFEKLDETMSKWSGRASGAAGLITGLSGAPNVLGFSPKELVRAGEKFAEEMRRAAEEAESAFGDMSDFLNDIGDPEGEFDRAAMEAVGEAEEEAAKKMKEQVEEFSKKLRVDVAGAFQEGLYDAMKSGRIEDFGKAFADSIKSQLANAFATGVTGAIFGVGDNAGSFNTGNILFGSGGVGGMIMGGGSIGPNDVAVDGGSGGGGFGSSGILGGVMSKMFKPIFGANNALNWGALGSNLLTAGVAGFAVNRLFGQGGLFGGRVVHGQEQIQLSGDINTQVGQASKQRDELIGSLVGVSQTTLSALQNMEFSYSWLAKHKSGNGITSKKTTTYEAVGVGAAQASIDMFMELSKKATAEAAARQFEIAMRGLENPLAALNMEISDLSAALANANEASRVSIEQQLRSAQAEKAQYKAAFDAAWFSTRLSTAAASAGNISIPGMEAGSFNVPNGIRANIRAYDTTPSHMMQLGLIQNQAQREFDLAKLQMSANESPAKMTEYLNARARLISDSLKTFEALMKDAAKRARDAEQGTKAAEQAVNDYSSAQAGYYNAQLEQLAIEKERQAAVKAEQDQRRNDILSTLVTAIGEARNVSGLGKVLVIRPDDPNFTDYLKEIRDGMDAEGQRVFDQILESKYGKNRGFSV